MLPVPMAAVLAALGPGPRDAARDAARHELARRPYVDARPPLLLRAVGRVLRALGDLLDGAAGRLGSGLPARLLLLAVVAVVVVVVLVRLGPLGRRRPAAGLFDGDHAGTADQHRARAGQLAAERRWAEAVRERLRAVVRELEGRGVLDPRPGRTAGEVARDAGAAVPALAGGLRRGAGVFDEVWYGGRPATAQSYEVLVGLDDEVRAAGRLPA